MATRRQQSPSIEHRHAGGGLRFDRKISLDTIVQIIGMAVVLGGPFIVWGRAMESRVLVLEGSTINFEKREAQREDFAKEQRSQMLDQLRKLESAVHGMQLSVAEMKAQLSARDSPQQRPR